MAMWRSLVPDSPWLGLFDLLAAPGHQQTPAEAWIKRTINVTSSQHMMSWQLFLETLMKTLPIVIDDKLEFKPLFHHFPNHMQIRTLELIYDHRHIIPRKKIQLFVCCMNSTLCQENKDSWIRFLLDGLDSESQHLQEKADHCELGTPPSYSDTACGGAGEKNEESCCGCGISGKPKYQFCDENKPLVQELISRLKKLDQGAGDPLGPVLDTGVCEGEESLILPVPIDVDSPVKPSPSSVDESLDKAGPSTQIPSDYRPHSNSQPHVLESPTCKLLSTIEKSSEEEPEKKKKKIDPCVSEISIPAKIQSCADSCLETWTNGESVSMETLKEITTVTELQFTQLCTCLRLGDLSDEAASVACHQVVLLQQEFPRQHAVVFARNCILPRVLSLERAAPRSLLLTCCEYARQFAAAFIEGVLVPTLDVADFGAAQCDLFLKVIKESFKLDNKLHLLQQIVKHLHCVTDVQIPLLQYLLEAKLELSPEFLTLLLRLCEASAVPLKKSLKFGKMLLAVINRYASQMTPAHTQSVHQTLVLHDTFMKKSGLAALSRAQSK